ncbi:MAG: hypothetical protein HDT44_00580 [Ruminococcaceae bacterium]|nr:hypothetical protein [Oscillospiraceae bacterium]
MPLAARFKDEALSAQSVDRTSTPKADNRSLHFQNFEILFKSANYRRLSLKAGLCLPNFTKSVSPTAQPPKKQSLVRTASLKNQTGTSFRIILEHSNKKLKIFKKCIDKLSKLW